MPDLLRVYGLTPPDGGGFLSFPVARAVPSPMQRPHDRPSAKRVAPARQPPQSATMRPLRGILLKLGSVLVFIAMASLVKSVSDRVPPGQAVFFRSFFRCR